MQKQVELRKRQLENLISVTRQNLEIFERELHNIINSNQAKRPLSNHEINVMNYRQRIMAGKRRKITNTK